MFYLFSCSWAGEREEASEEVAGGGGPVLIKIEGRGSIIRGGGAGEGRAPGECLWGGGGEIFFFGVEMPINNRSDSNHCFFGELILDMQVGETCWGNCLTAARLQNETAPETFLYRYKNGLKKREKRIRKTIRNVSENVKAPLTPLKHFSPALSKSFSPPKLCTKKVFCSPRSSAGTATLKLPLEQKLSRLEILDAIYFCFYRQSPRRKFRLDWMSRCEN